MSAIVYQENIKLHQSALQKLKLASTRIAWIRFFAIAAAIGIFVMKWTDYDWAAVIVMGFCVAFFLRMVVVAGKISSNISHTQQLISINHEELEIGQGSYFDKYDGVEFLPNLHPYAYDLDLLGKASLYQYSQRTETFMGRRSWATWLLQCAKPAEIAARQQAAQSLKASLEWRQAFQATGRLSPITKEVYHRLIAWQKSDDGLFQANVWKVIRLAGPLVSIGFLMAYIFDYINFSQFSWYFVIFFLITGYISKKATPAYNALGKMAAEIKTLSQLLACIEAMPTFQSTWLQQHKQAVHTGDGVTASIAIKQLNGILQRFDYRLNPVVFIPLNVLLFWDLQQMLQLRQWQKQYGTQLENWLTVLGEVEALSTIATLAYNQPEWCFPEWEPQHGTFNTTKLGHPLIAAPKRVVSDFATRGTPMVSIITGSNMAGKSTFLRSVGLAMVMGQAGAPVCATAATFSNMQVISSMRIADNLAESTSTFYAELKKLKQMIDAVNSKQPVMLLMDEILRGTNSLDRHKGSKALIEQLIHQQAIGIVATHDLELAELEKTYPNAIRNYHFDVQVAGEELYFDYALKTGVCQSLNASILMKKIGIELRD